ncbi:MAG: nucleotide exchange factor GrpE [Deltaproteobacteria bacterium]|nr:nucleotide exchange factor GrpE [Deltaproteobacteria bacterium]
METAETTGGSESGDQAAAPSELEVLKTQLKDQQNKYLYLYADFENYKKRAIKERSDLLKFGHESLSREILQVADNLDRALEHTEKVDALVSGIKMVNQQLKDTLGKFGVTPVTSLGQKFDPELQEAVSQEKGTNSQEDGTVIREHQKGYTLHGRLLRPARVVVATK